MKIRSERYAGKACVVNDVLVVFDAETREGSVACWSDPTRSDAAPTELREEDIAVCRAMPKHFEIVEDGAGDETKAASDETETGSGETTEAVDGAEEVVAETEEAAAETVAAEALAEEKPAAKKASASKKQPAAK